MSQPQQPAVEPAIGPRSAATRQALITAARQLFVVKGYFNTGTEEIVAAAGVGTRGALYHQFADKQALFLAVFEAVEQDLVAAATASDTVAGPFARLRAGLLGFLDASLSGEVQQILLIDGPAVLGWDTWRSVEQKYGLGILEHLLAEAQAAGEIPPQPIQVVAHLLLAAVDEAALMIANAEDKGATRDSVVPVVERLLDGIRAGDSDRP
jgi:AcrR family transcriptional regulator